MTTTRLARTTVFQTLSATADIFDFDAYPLPTPCRYWYCYLLNCMPKDFNLLVLYLSQINFVMNCLCVQFVDVHKLLIMWLIILITFYSGWDQCFFIRHLCNHPNYKAVYGLVVTKNNSSRIFIQCKCSKRVLKMFINCYNLNIPDILKIFSGSRIVTCDVKVWREIVACYVSQMRWSTLVSLAV